MKTKFKIIFDMSLNILATAIPLIGLQLIVLPILAQKMGEESYGMALTVISIVTIVSGALGNALNNMRLVKSNLYEKTGLVGDFNILLILESVIGSTIVAIAVCNLNVGFAECLWIIVMSVLWLLREYFIVVFRLHLDYVGVVINNTILIVGYLIGFAFFCVTGIWQFIYIVGLLLSLLYMMCCKNCVEKTFVLSPHYKQTVRELVFLVFAAFVNSMLNYADRLIIYPLLGGVAVSVYYASTLFGKIISTAISPINAVVLSYLAKKESMEKALFRKVFLSGCILSGVGYVACRIVAHPALKLLYPQWVDESIKYVPTTTAVAMITMINSILSPFILKFRKMKWQLIINIVTVLCYFILSICGFLLFGLQGFCMGILLSQLIKMMIMLFLGLRDTK